MAGDDYIVESATPFTSKFIVEEAVASDYAQLPIEYDEVYEFDRFFKTQAGFMVL